MKKYEALQKALEIVQASEKAKGLDGSTASAIGYATLYAHCSLFLTEKEANKILEIVSERLKKS